MTGPRKGLFQRGRQPEGFWRRGADRAIVVTSRPALARRFPMLRTRALVGLLAPSIVLGCATNKPFDRTTEPGGRPLSQTTAGSVILTGEDLSANPGWTVLDAIRRAMPQVKVSTGRGLNPCPLVELRGRDSVTGNSDPDVYVDGTRTVDTCPLVTLQAIEARDRKSTRLNSSHSQISYAVFCLKKKKILSFCDYSVLHFVSLTR